SAKSFFRPRGPWLLLAWHRCNVPAILGAHSRFWRAGFQYRSSVPHTGFQYCAVDSMTTSSTSCWSSHWASTCNSPGVAPNLRRSNRYSPSPATSGPPTSSCERLLLRFDMPSCFSLGGAESMPKGIPRQGHVAIAAPEGDERRPIIRAERACSGSNRVAASTSPLSQRPYRSHHCHDASFSSTFAGRRPIPTGSKNHRHGRPPAGWQAKACPTLNRRVFHGISRAEGPFKQATKGDGLSHPSSTA